MKQLLIKQLWDLATVILPFVVMLLSDYCCGRAKVSGECSALATLLLTFLLRSGIIAIALFLILMLFLVLVLLLLSISVAFGVTLGLLLLVPLLLGLLLLIPLFVGCCCCCFWCCCFCR